MTVDNLDGKGPIDWSGSLLPEGPLTIDRRLNEPSACTWMLMAEATGAPARLGRVVVTTQGGTVIFTGYLTCEPERVYAGASSEGLVFHLRCMATSDEWLLDKQGGVSAGASFGAGGATLLQILTSRTDPTLFQSAEAATVLSVGSFGSLASRRWSANAGAIADAAYATYRVIGGEVELMPVGVAAHALSLADGTLQPEGLQLRYDKELVNDVTLSGAMEPGAYVTEIFLGDGTTDVFELAGAPFRGTAQSRAVLADSFDEATLSAQTWQVNDPGSHLGLGAQGLTVTGGNGMDGATTLMASSAMELGGALVLEAQAVLLQQGSDGVLLGVYAGRIARTTCLAGFDVRQSNGSTTVGALIQGSATGTPFALASGHTYTMRMRLHSTEMQRALQTYYVMIEGKVQRFGGGTISAALDVVLELQDNAASSNTPATVLYDGRIGSAPASASFAAVNSVQLVGSIGAIQVTQSGSAWVTSTSASGTTMTRLTGTAGEGVDCSLSAAGELRFFSGRVPAAGERITVSYRGSQRSVARMQDAASVGAEAQGGLPGEAQWLGSVLEPRTRSSEDCASAAAAVLAIGGDRNAALAGEYTGENLPDVWPGDLLTLGEGSPIEGQVEVQRAILTDAGSVPELVRWKLQLANGWAQSRSIRLSSTIAADALLPEPVAAATPLPGLNALAVASVSGSSIQIDAGVDPPTGGGFEVRRRDGAFGAGVGADLVLRSQVRAFAIPREGQTERYYIRPFDGSTPPVYSRRSSAVFTDVPVS